MLLHKHVVRFCVLAAVAIAAAWLAAPAQAGFVVFSAGGNATTASIQGTVDSFRTALGNPNNANNPGLIVGGRREINWDGGGATTSTSTGTPLTAFTNIRGATMSTPGTGFLQTPLNDAALTGIQASYATTFGFFSSQRIFTPLGSNITDVTFSIPGSSGLTPAVVGGFGAVFSDVDLANVTRLEFFGPANNQILSLNVTPGTVPSGSLSFLGAIGNAGEQISRVRITTGNSALGLPDANGDNVDVVVMDDFLYSEPAIVPEPASALLAALGLLGGLAFIRRRAV